MPGQDEQGYRWYQGSAASDDQKCELQGPIRGVSRRQQQKEENRTLSKERPVMLAESGQAIFRSLITPICK